MLNKKRMIKILIYIVLLLLLSPLCVSAATPESVLIIYHDSGIKDTLSELVTASGAQPVAVRTSDGIPNHLDDYAVILAADPAAYAGLSKTDTPVIYIGRGFENIQGISVHSMAKTIKAELSLSGMQQTVLMDVPFDYIANFSGEAAGTMRLSGIDYPLAAGSGSVSLIPYFNRGDLSAFAAADLLNGYLALEAEPKAYVLIDEIYPFDDLALLRRTADAFSKSGIPIICRVMPVYENTDYPAFDRFIDTLLYMRSKGASFVLHDPIISGEPTDGETPEDKAKQAVRAYRVAGIDVQPFRQTPFRISPAFLASLKTGIHEQLSFPVDVMVGFPVFSDEAEINTAVELVSGARLTISDYSNGMRYVYTGETISEPTAPDPEADASGAEPAFGAFVQTSSRVFTVIIIISAISVLVLIVVGYRIYMNKFIKKK